MLSEVRLSSIRLGVTLTRADGRGPSRGMEPMSRSQEIYTFYIFLLFYFIRFIRYKIYFDAFRFLTGLLGVVLTHMVRSEVHGKLLLLQRIPFGCCKTVEIPPHDQCTKQLSFS